MFIESITGTRLGKALRSGPAGAEAASDLTLL